MARADAEERVVDPVIEAFKAGIDRTLIRQNLRRSIDERIDQLTAMSRFFDEMRRARWTAAARR